MVVVENLLTLTDVKYFITRIIPDLFSPLLYIYIFHYKHTHTLIHPTTPQGSNTILCLYL